MYICRLRNVKFFVNFFSLPITKTQNGVVKTRINQFGDSEKLTGEQVVVKRA